MNRLLRVLLVAVSLFVIQAGRPVTAMHGCNEYDCEWCFTPNGACHCFPEDDLICDIDRCFQCECQPTGSCAFIPI